MASKKKGQLTRYCRIYQWIEEQDSVFAEAIRDLCLEGKMAASGSTPGITFLYPKDPAYRQEIVDKAFSDKANEAEKMIESLIIPDLFTQAADFGRRAVGNRNRVSLAVENVGDGRVTFAGGLTISPAKFSPLGERSIAVWNIDKGRVPLEGKSYTPPAPQRRPTGVRGGAAEGPRERARLACSLEAEFDCCQRAGRGNICNPYLAKVVSLLNYLRAERPELLVTVLPVLDYDPFISFYLLLEPYKSGGSFLIPNDALFGDGAWNCADAYGDAVAEFKSYFEAPSGLGMDSPPPFMYRDRAAVSSQIDTVRLAVKANNPRQIPQAVQDAYLVLARQNAIAGMSPIMASAAHKALASRKMWQDEFRFTFHEAMQELLARPYNPQDFATITQDLRTSWPGNDYSAETVLTNVNDYAQNVAPRTELLLLGKFLNSSDFLYLPVPPSMASVTWGDRGNMSADNWEMYNRNAVALENLGHISGMSRPSGLSPQAMQELRIYVKTHGSLPPSVASLAGAAPSAGVFSPSA